MFEYHLDSKVSPNPILPWNVVWPGCDANENEVGTNPVRQMMVHLCATLISSEYSSPRSVVEKDRFERTSYV